MIFIKRLTLQQQLSDSSSCLSGEKQLRDIWEIGYQKRNLSMWCKTYYINVIKKKMERKHIAKHHLNTNWFNRYLFKCSRNMSVIILSMGIHNRQDFWHFLDVFWLFAQRCVTRTRNDEPQRFVKHLFAPTINRCYEVFSSLQSRPIQLKINLKLSLSSRTDEKSLWMECDDDTKQSNLKIFSPSELIPSVLKLLLLLNK